MTVLTPASSATRPAPWSAGGFCLAPSPDPIPSRCQRVCGHVGPHRTYEPRRVGGADPWRGPARPVMFNVADQVVAEWDGPARLAS